MDKEFEQRVQQISINALIDIALGCERLQLFTAKLDAFRVINGRCKKYRELGYDSQIVLTVLEKKLELLKKAATVKKTAKISEPSAPTYHYNGMFETDDSDSKVKQGLSVCQGRAAMSSLPFQDSLVLSGFVC